MLKQELIENIRQISLRSPKSEAEMKSLESECIELMRQIGNFGLANNCPDMVLHYLTDVDIRYRDPEYAHYQYPLFTAALDEWAK